MKRREPCVERDCWGEAEPMSDYCRPDKRKQEIAAHVIVERQELHKFGVLSSSCQTRMQASCGGADGDDEPRRFRGVEVRGRDEMKGYRSSFCLPQNMFGSE